MSCDFNSSASLKVDPESEPVHKPPMLATQVESAQLKIRAPGNKLSPHYHSTDRELKRGANLKIKLKSVKAFQINFLS